MRISDTKVVQHVDSDPPVLVLVDDQTGAEMVFSPTDLQYLDKALRYFAPIMGLDLSPASPV